MKKFDYIIGIDPDTRKSGVCIIAIESKKVELLSMTFPKLIDFLKDSREILPSLQIVVEAGWLNESNWHLSRFDSKQKSAAKGNSVGRNHETGRKIVEMCKHYQLDVIEQRPLRKFWTGPDGKITHEEINQFIPSFPSRSNQEIRDAALLAWHHAGFPIKVHPLKSK